MNFQYLDKKESGMIGTVFLVSASILIMGVYLISMPGTIVLEDDGYFVLAAFYSSVTHPPGYPLFIFLSHIFTWIPAGSMAFRIHMASAFFGVVACLLFWNLARCLSFEKIYAFMAMFLLAFSRTFWSQAIIAEVYTLNVLLFILLFFLCFKLYSTDKYKQDILFKWIFFIYGLSLANHWPLIILSTPSLLALVWPYRHYLTRNFIRFIPFTLIGLLPYLWMVWRSHMVPEYSFYGPIQSLQELLFYISRKPYEALDYTLTAGLIDKLLYLKLVILETSRQIMFPGILLMLVGLVVMWKKCPFHVFLSTIMGYAGSTLFLILVRGIDYDRFGEMTFSVYPLISYVFVIIWILYGLRYCIMSLDKHSGNIINQSFLTGSIFILLVLGSLLINFRYNFRNNDLLADEYGRTVLNSLPHNAIFYANADNIDGPIRYLNQVEFVRPDVTVFNGRYLEFKNQIYRPYQMAPDELKSLIKDLINDTDRPVFFVNDFPNDYAKVRYGYYTGIDKTRPVGSKDVVIINPNFINQVLNWPVKYKLVNDWEMMHFNLMKSDFCDLVLNAKYSNTHPAPGKVARLVSAVCQNYWGILNQLKFALNSEHLDRDYINKLFEQAEKSRGQAYTKKDMSKMDYYKGIYFLRVNKNKQADLYLKLSLKIWPHPENPANNPDTTSGKIQ